ncbi:MAG: hypothetical protein Q8Q35_00940 [Nanoarchaeota archaeon]|nr:hypothetical protein [Nanoarchaeota archaeon]
MILDDNLTICIGLWLAEGDNKTKSEITFTNNCPELIILFHNTLTQHFKLEDYRARVYIYNMNKKEINAPVDKVRVKRYIDKRARKPYYIWRLGSVKHIKLWKEIVKLSLKDKRNSKNILKGFFAGEGNINFISSNSKISRKIRIAQKQENPYIEKIMDYLKITYRFRHKDRAYEIWGKPNWDTFKRLKLADLHPNKKERFYKAYNTFKEEHYPTWHLGQKVIDNCFEPITCKSLSKLLKRSPSRICEILSDLKKENKVYSFRVRSLTYWTLNKEIIIISSTKQEYLRLLNINNYKTSEIARILKVCPKSANNRLFELKKLKLINRNLDKSWTLSFNNKEIIVK